MLVVLSNILFTLAVLGFILLIGWMALWGHTDTPEIDEEDE